MKDSNFVLLGNFESLEAEIVESILRQMDIPVFKQYPDSGGYMEIYAGFSQFGVSLYVPARELDKAREVIENKSEESW